MVVFEAEHIGVQYLRGGKSFVPFSDVSFSLEGGRIYDLAGPSGSGKSTLLSACALMIPRTGGEMRLDGVSFKSMRPDEWRRQVCLVPQSVSLVPGTVRDNLLFPWTLKVNAQSSRPTDEDLTELLKKAALDGVELGHSAVQLSGGQQARVALLRVFATHPRVMLLDEVEAALDDESATAVSRLTRCMLTKDTACLRIRHRVDDGYAYGKLVLDDGVITYKQNPPTATNMPVSDL